MTSLLWGINRYIININWLYSSQFGTWQVTWRSIGMSNLTESKVVHLKVLSFLYGNIDMHICRGWNQQRPRAWVWQVAPHGHQLAHSRPRVASFRWLSLHRASLKLTGSCRQVPAVVYRAGCNFGAWGALLKWVIEMTPHPWRMLFLWHHWTHN